MAPTRFLRFATRPRKVRWSACSATARGRARRRATRNSTARRHNSRSRRTSSPLFCSCLSCWPSACTVAATVTRCFSRISVRQTPLREPSGRQDLPNSRNAMPRVWNTTCAWILTTGSISMTFGILLPALLLAAPTPDAADLIARLKRPVPASTAYTEVRFLHQLTRPLVLRGELDYGGADKLGKRVDAPYRESTTISGDNVTVTRA